MSGIITMDTGTNAGVAANNKSIAGMLTSASTPTTASGNKPMNTIPSGQPLAFANHQQPVITLAYPQRKIKMPITVSVCGSADNPEGNKTETTPMKMPKSPREFPVKAFRR
ncbi:MAG: hypothetical protein HOP33_16410 [Verrucomicrobia bacterium]|nr:hypothetical protein [Verrucomicrobiota bacterium]